jgi:hypothetical protein
LILGLKVCTFSVVATPIIYNKLISSAAGKSIAPAPSILQYLRDVTSRHGIDKHIKYHHAVEALDWSSELQRWKLQVKVNEKEQKTFYARFVIMSTGYYDYKQVSSLRSRDFASLYELTSSRHFLRRFLASKTSKVR